MLILCYHGAWGTRLILLVLVKCYDIKMVLLPFCLFMGAGTEPLNEEAVPLTKKPRGLKVEDMTGLNEKLKTAEP